MEFQDTLEQLVLDRTKLTAYGVLKKDLYANEDFQIDLSKVEPGYALKNVQQGANIAEIRAIKFEGDCRSLPIPLLIPVPNEGDSQLDEEDKKCAAGAKLKWVLELKWMSFAFIPTFGTVKELLTEWEKKSSNCQEKKRELESRFDCVEFGGCDDPTAPTADSVAYGTLVPKLVARGCVPVEVGHKTIKNKQGPISWNTYLAYAGGDCPKYKNLSSCSCAQEE